MLKSFFIKLLQIVTLILLASELYAQEVEKKHIDSIQKQQNQYPSYSVFGLKEINSKTNSLGKRQFKNTSGISKKNLIYGGTKKTNALSQRIISGACVDTSSRFLWEEDSTQISSGFISKTSDNNILLPFPGIGIPILPAIIISLLLNSND